ncbi:H-type lectin domain-containing protein [Vibrio coralliilyticus]|uniref:H-type lectin domain-containing protein n=1 Tax=Vibrio coralliilyticus TaxID=190893 RepID=UPI0039174D0C
MKQVIGKVSYSGDVEIGQGFQAERHSAGLFKVYFDSNLFDSTPVVVVTPDTSRESSETYTVATSLKNVSESGFTLSIENLSADTYDATFNFIAITQ